MSARGFFGVLCLGLVLASGCDDASEVNIQAADYDRSCQGNDDCTLIYVGDVCSSVCTPGGIATSAKELYFADRNAAECENGIPDCSGGYAECQNNSCVGIAD